MINENTPTPQEIADLSDYCDRLCDQNENIDRAYTESLIERNRLADALHEAHLDRAIIGFISLVLLGVLYWYYEIRRGET
jgi:hypothetical protein